MASVLCRFAKSVQDKYSKWNNQIRQRAYRLLKCIKLRAYHADESVQISNLSIIPSKHANMKNKLV